MYRILSANCILTLDYVIFLKSFLIRLQREIDDRDYAQSYYLCIFNWNPLKMKEIVIRSFCPYFLVKAISFDLYFRFGGALRLRHSVKQIAYELSNHIVLSLQVYWRRCWCRKTTASGVNARAARADRRTRCRGASERRARATPSTSATGAGKRTRPRRPWADTSDLSAASCLARYAPSAVADSSTDSS